jgi:hypothetical protein
VHVLVQHKVIAHLCCIAAWVAAVTVDARLQAAPWWRALAWPAVDAVAFAHGAAPWAHVLGTVACWLGVGVLGVVAVAGRIARGSGPRSA